MSGARFKPIPYPVFEQIKRSDMYAKLAGNFVVGGLIRKFMPHFADRVEAIVKGIAPMRDSLRNAVDSAARLNDYIEMHSKLLKSENLSWASFQFSVINEGINNANSITSPFTDEL